MHFDDSIVGVLITFDDMFQIISFTKKPFTSLYYSKNTAAADYNRILFSGVKVSKEVCIHHIEHEPVLLTAKEIYFFMIAHQIHQLLHMQRCSYYFNVSIMVMYLTEP